MQRSVAGALIVIGWLVGACGTPSSPRSPATPSVSSVPTANQTPRPLVTPIGGEAVPPASVVAIDSATGTVVRVVPVGRDPLLLSVAAGQVWTLDFGPGALSRIDPGDFVRTEIKVDGQAVGMASDGQDIWVAANEHFLVRIDGATGRVEATTKLADEPLFRLRDAGFLAVANGEVWMTIPVVGRPAEPQTLWRIDASTGAVTKRYPLPRDPLTPIVVDGVVWVPVLGSSSLARVDPATDDVRDVPLGDIPHAVAFGDGSIWVVLGFSWKVVRLQPSDGSVEAEIRVDSTPRGVTFGGGYVWVATEGGLSQIDPRTNSIVRELRLVELRRDVGGTDVEFLDGSVWVSIE